MSSKIDLKNYICEDRYMKSEEHIYSRETCTSHKLRATSLKNLIMRLRRWELMTGWVKVFNLWRLAVIKALKHICTVYWRLLFQPRDLSRILEPLSKFRVSSRGAKVFELIVHPFIHEEDPLRHMSSRSFSLNYFPSWLWEAHECLINRRKWNSCHILVAVSNKSIEWYLELKRTRAT